MSRIYLCHSLSHGTSAHGSALGDGSNATFKTHGWQWARTRNAWYVPESKAAMLLILRRRPQSPSL